MAQIGTFKKDGSGYSGTLQTFTLKADITLEPIRSSNDKAPDFEVHAGPTKVGIAYKRTAESGNEYISVLLDDPTFAKPIWANLLLGNGIDGLPLMWDRPKPKKAE
jgi:uncharacterized protein (DUF736 family)